VRDLTVSGNYEEMRHFVAYRKEATRVSLVLLSVAPIESGKASDRRDPEFPKGPFIARRESSLGNCMMSWAAAGSDPESVMRRGLDQETTEETVDCDISRKGKG
jgi:hypothetical protein